MKTVLRRGGAKKLPCRCGGDQVDVDGDRLVVTGLPTESLPLTAGLEELVHDVVTAIGISYYGW